MPSCGCSGASCGCLIQAGAGIRISGAGTGINPYVIDATATGISGLMKVSDTATVDMSLTGTGSPADPYNVSAVAIMKLTDLKDVSSPAPTAGQSPTWVPTNGSVPGHWEFKIPATAPPGAVNVGAGLSGDGSAPSALKVRTSGTWGTAPLAGYGTDSLIGSPIYVDSAGNLRSAPDGMVPVANGVRPAQFPGKTLFELTSKLVYVSDGTTWSLINPKTWDASAITSGVLPVARIPNLDAAKITTGQFNIARIPYMDRDATTTRVYFTTGADGPGPKQAWIGLSPETEPDNSWTFWVRHESEDQNLIAVNDDGRLQVLEYIETPATYTHGITGSPRSVVITSGGFLGVPSSSARYKDDIRSADLDPAKVLAINPVTFKAKPGVDLGGDPDGRHFGLIAEQVAELVPDLVFYDDQGRPDGVAYEKLAVALLFVLREHEFQIHRLLDQKQ
jgi:hypothetical protein